MRENETKFLERREKFLNIVFRFSIIIPYQPVIPHIMHFPTTFIPDGFQRFLFGLNNFFHWMKQGVLYDQSIFRSCSILVRKEETLLES